MNRATGQAIDVRAHIIQSIGDICSTPVGTRVMRRTYGSRAFDLVDAPGNPAGSLRLLAAHAEAIARWEPRVSLASASLSIGFDGRAEMAIEVVITADASPLSVSIPVAPRTGGLIGGAA